MQWQPTTPYTGVPDSTAYATAPGPSTAPATTTTTEHTATVSAPLFGVIIPGCPVQTNLDQVDSGHWTLRLGYAPESFVVFLTMTAPLPPGYGVGIFLAREDAEGFQYIGALTQQCASTILKVPTTFLSTDQPIMVVLGLSLEPEAELANLGTTQEQPLHQVRAATKVAIGERLLEDLYCFVTSYARSINWGGETFSGNGLKGLEPGDYVMMPTSFVDRWRTRLQTRLQKDSTFWH